MAQQILDVSIPNSGLGDALRDASIKSNDNFTELYQGKVDKVLGKDLSDNNFTDAFVTKINDLEANAQVNVQSDWNENDILADAYIKNKPEQLFSSLGYFDYADLATQTTPITVAPDTETLLTNDTLGDDTNTSQPPYGVTAIWDADSDEFNFQQLSVGDTVDIRVHLKTTTTTANQKYHIDMKFAFDSPNEFENRIFSQVVKTSGEDEQTFITTLYIGSESVKNYPARLYITSDDDATVKVVGWFCRVFRKSVNIVDIITDEAPIDGLTYGRKDAGWVEVSGGGGSTPDATTTVKGKLKLAGDLAGTADLPTVPNKLDKNTPIVGATKTKITYDSNGLVTAGADATTADINDTTTRRYVTDTQISTWNAMIGGSIFQSVWNASTNTPSLSSGVGTKGYYYIVSVDGTTNLDGISDWKIGDWAIFDGTVWRKVDNTDAISSFNGRTGAISLLDTDVTSALGFTPVSSLNSSLTGLTTLTGTTQTGSSGVGTLSLIQTWNTTGSPTAIILNVTNTASGAAARLLDLQTGGVSRFAVDKLGGMSATLITSTAEINAGLANSFTWGTTNSRATIFSPSNGVIRLSNGTGTDFSRLQFGLTNSTAPAIKRNGTALNFRLADDSADCPVTASNGTFSGNIIASGATSVVRLKGYTVATLPSGTQGDNAFVTDALAPTILNTVVGGGAVVVRVFYNGTNWIVQ